MNKYIRGTIFEIPAVCLLLIVSWMVVCNVGSLIQKYFGGIVMIISMPIWWYYIVSPILEVIWEFFEENFWD